MSYQVIARKYRPQRFADVVGQEHVTNTLANAIRQNRIAHAYLFVGPRGTGKTTIARIFSMCLNCTGGPKVEFPEDDPRCREISEGRSLDVLEIDGASNRGIEEIRELRETVKFAPANSKFKIYIIDEVHMLTKEAFNALLKTLEEPPEHVKFMFATTEPEKVLPTILSRCQRYDLRRIPVALIVKHLGGISQQEGVKVDEGGLYAIARGAEGCMRDAESTLDQLISFCGNEICEADVLSMFGLAARRQILEMAGAMLQGDLNATLRTLDDLSRNGKDLGRLVSDLLNHFRNLLLFQVSKGDLSLMEVTETEAAMLAEQGKDVPMEVITRIMDILVEGESRLRDTVSKKTWVEITLVKAIQVRHAVSIDELLKTLQQLRAGGATPAMEASIPEVRPVRAPIAPVKATRTVASVSVVNAEKSPVIAGAAATVPVASNGVSATVASTPVAVAVASSPAPAASGDLDAQWAAIVEAVGRVSAFTRSYLLNAFPVSLANSVFTIGFGPEYADHISLVDNKKNREIIQKQMAELGMGDLHVKVIQAPAPVGHIQTVAKPSISPPPVSSPVAAEQPAPHLANPPAAEPKKVVTRTEPKAAKPAPMVIDQEEFKNDPLIKQALELFKGQWLGVKAPNQSP